MSDEMLMSILIANLLINVEVPPAIEMHAHNYNN